jgi:hypothetical protein
MVDVVVNIVVVATGKFQGTNIAAGKCRGLVIGTGLNTEIGNQIHLINFCLQLYFSLKILE